MLEIEKSELPFSGLANGGDILRADWVAREELSHVLAALTPPNRLAMEISAATGLRIGDVLSLRTEQLRNASERRVSVRAQKTGKLIRVKLPVDLYERALRQAGRVWVFEGRLDWRRPRTRQAVYKDVVRAARLFRCRAHISPHTARKAFAVAAYQRTGGNAQRVQKLLQHSSEAVTMIYALADELTRRRLGEEAAH